jgi:myosin heavy subunit
MQILESAELLDSYKRRQGELIEKLEEYEQNREEKNQEIAQLKLQLQEEESMQTEVDKWQRRYQNINYELEVQKTKMKESIEGAWDSEQELFIQELIDKSESAVKAKEEMTRENSSLQEENEQQGALLRWMEEQQEELQEEMERLKGLIAVSYGEAEALRSQVEELKEERVKNVKEIGFWRGEFDRSIQNETQRIYYHTQTSQNQMQQLMDIKLKYSTNQYSSVDNDIDNGNAVSTSSNAVSMPGVLHAANNSAASIDNAVNNVQSNANIANNINNANNVNNKEIFAPSESCFIIDEGAVTFNK